jgi:DNA polymerase I-like protein with 3'-5' exonuclease and polymerase domains
VRSPHSAFNAKIQGWGSEVVKKGISLRYQHVLESGIDSIQVGYYHDEWQAEVREGQENDEVEISQRAIRESGEYYNLSVPMHGESKIGRNWYETH